MTVQPESPTPPVAPLRVADLEIDVLDRRLRQGQREVRLTAGEHTILCTLASNAGAWVTYREIAAALGRSNPALGDDNTLARHIDTLRVRLRDDAAHPRYIETLDGIGYRLMAA